MNWQRQAACTDYQMYVRAWFVAQTEQRDKIIAALNALGKVECNAMCNVANLNAEWGFMVIPPLNFPEIKICFRVEISAITVAEILSYVDKIIINN
jgi:hypothetical protein